MRSEKHVLLARNPISSLDTATSWIEYFVRHYHGQTDMRSEMQQHLKTVFLFRANILSYNLFQNNRNERR